MVDAGVCKYLVYGREIGENGTPHLQGHVKFINKKRFGPAKAALHATAHIEVARDVVASVTYCKKDGDWVEFGDASTEKGVTIILGSI